MSQSLSKIYIHATFGTRGRFPWINDKIAPKLHAYIASILKENGSPAVIINSVPDHIHVLFRMSKTVTISQLLEDMKKSSSVWMKAQSPETSSFYWQKGYGAFSVSRSGVETVSRYIANQKEHHEHMSYREELEGFMKKYDVDEYDPKYFWD